MLLSPVLTFIVLVVGILIGGVGIGGVLLVPALKYLGGIPLHVAIPACMFSYIVTGLVGAFIYARHGTINWPLAIKVCVGALPGAYIGAFLLPYFSAIVLELGIALLILASGIYAWRNNGPPNDDSGSETNRCSSTAALVAIGLITGIGSALTGTGGPLLLVPILIWRKLPILTAIGLSQAIQVPISVMATLGNLVYTEVDIKLGLTLALVLGGGALLGAKVSHMLPVEILKKSVAGLLIAVGLVMLYRLPMQL
ncbi:sulfite exporter TauE/SafE family protein [Candidatus Spongiihabitans sp.]|uniref:sulfite exporter TauE/SafE family protein n=1 Tax=Candidatus Spongiihabitans sp. TaxID=3101308 RepID=UPI003C7DB7CA